MAVAMTFVIASAEIDLSIGSVAGLASVVAAMAIPAFGPFVGERGWAVSVQPGGHLLEGVERPFGQKSQQHLGGVGRAADGVFPVVQNCVEVVMR